MLSLSVEMDEDFVFELNWLADGDDMNATIIHIKNQGAEMWLKLRKNELHLYSFYSTIPNRGYGKALMRALLRLADMYLVSITLIASPSGSMPLEKLISYYESFEFKQYVPRTVESDHNGKVLTLTCRMYRQIPLGS